MTVLLSPTSVIRGAQVTRALIHLDKHAVRAWAGWLLISRPLRGAGAAHVQRPCAEAWQVPRPVDGPASASPTPMHSMVHREYLATKYLLAHRLHPLCAASAWRLVTSPPSSTSDWLGSLPPPTHRCASSIHRTTRSSTSIAANAPAVCCCCCSSASASASLPHGLCAIRSAVRPPLMRCHQQPLPRQLL